jgi:hypothetical protein
MADRDPWAQEIGAAEERRREEREEIEAETKAMSDAYKALQPVGHYGRERALRWLARALDVTVDPPF